MKAIKEFGQHFLTDDSIAQSIVDAAHLSKTDTVWEIGPGLGILTGKIIDTGAKLKAFEIDRRMKAILQERYADAFELVMRDILKIDWGNELPDNVKIKLVANIPYQITSPLLYKLSDYADHFECIVIMIQKEVAERLVAFPSTRQYGQLTIKVRLLFDIKYLFNVSFDMFDPPPKVDSSVVMIKPRINKPEIRNLDIFYRLVQCAFAHRRKTLRNNLVPLVPKVRMDELETRSKISLSRRGETLSEDEYILLSDIIAEL